MKVNIIYGPYTDEVIQEAYQYMVKIYREEMKRQEKEREKEEIAKK